MEFRVGVVTGDIDASVAFYRDALGFPVEHSWHRTTLDRGVVFDAGKGKIELVLERDDLPKLKAYGVWLYLQVPNVDAAFARAKACGAEVLLAPTSETWGHRRVRLRDPNGLIIGLYDTSTIGDGVDGSPPTS